MKMFMPVPLPKFGRSQAIDIPHLLRLKSVADKWKSLLQNVKGSHGDKIRHSDYSKKPNITIFEPVESQDAVLMPIVGGK